jgi:hypothetical protein
MKPPIVFSNVTVDDFMTGAENKHPSGAVASIYTA